MVMFETPYYNHSSRVYRRNRLGPVGYEHSIV